MTIEQITSWQGLTVRQYQLVHVAKTTKDLVSVVYSLSAPEVDSMRMSDYRRLADPLSFLAEPPDMTFNRVVSGLHLIQLDYMEMGCFVDLNDSLLLEPSMNMHEILASVYRPLDEQYSYILRMERAKGIQDMKICDLYAAYHDLVSWREKLFTDYAGLFGEPDPEDSYPEELLTEQDRIDIETRRNLKGENTREKFGRRWGLFPLVERLCHGDIRAKDDILQMPVRSCFNWLAYQFERDQLSST